MKEIPPEILIIIIEFSILNQNLNNKNSILTKFCLINSIWKELSLNFLLESIKIRNYTLDNFIQFINNNKNKQLVKLKVKKLELDLMNFIPIEFLLNLNPIEVLTESNLLKRGKINLQEYLELLPESTFPNSKFMRLSSS